MSICRIKDKEKMLHKPVLNSGRLLIGGAIGLTVGVILEMNVHPAVIGLVAGILVTLLISTVPGPLEGAVVGLILGSVEYIILVSNDLVVNPNTMEKLTLLSWAILIGSLIGAITGGLIGWVFQWLNKGKKVL
jgi:hypothetical protein